MEQPKDKKQKQSRVFLVTSEAFDTMEVTARSAAAAYDYAEKIFDAEFGAGAFDKLTVGVGVANDPKVVA